MEASLSELLFAGVRLMFIGMTIVFLFLALLVWVIGMSARLMNRYSPEEPESMTAALGARDSGGEDENIVAVITAAIHRHLGK
ncbi:MAG: oxaloacetate decarboxylase, gamma subunit [Pseudomonadota bacterium]